MKIKLAILDSNANYLTRMVTSFGTKYADKIELYSFSDKDLALSTLHSARIDVFIASDSYEIQIDEIPTRCAFAYFVESADIESVNNEKAICKFQKAELIYKQILSLYAEKAENLSGIRIDDDSCKVYGFVSVGGGSGSSSMAAACALRFARQGKRTLYLNFEKYGTADSYFGSEGQFTISDVIFALKSKKSNLSLKLESNVRQDPRGVYYYAGAPVLLDILELKSDDIIRLISELRLTGGYDYIVLDTDFGLDEETMKLLHSVTVLTLVSNGSETDITKLSRALTALDIIEQGDDTRLTDKMRIAYNMFSNKTSKTLGGIEIKEIGGAPRYQYASTSEVVEALSALDIFDKIEE